MDKKHGTCAGIRRDGTVCVSRKKGYYLDQIFGPSPEYIPGCRNGPSLITTEYEDYRWWSWLQRKYGPERIGANGHEGFERLTYDVL